MAIVDSLYLPHSYDQTLDIRDGDDAIPAGNFIASYDGTLTIITSASIERVAKPTIGAVIGFYGDGENTTGVCVLAPSNFNILSVATHRGPLTIIVALDGSLMAMTLLPVEYGSHAKVEPTAPKGLAASKGTGWGSYPPP